MQDPHPESVFTQGLLFEAPEPEITTIENCQAITAPVMQTVKGKKEWTCAFTALPDLWHQDRDELIYASTTDIDVVRMASRTRLQPGDTAALKGIITLTQELIRGGKVTRLTYLHLMEIRAGLRQKKHPG